MQVTRLQVSWMHYFAWYLNHIGLLVDDHEQLSYVLNIKQSVGLFMKSNEQRSDINTCTINNMITQIIKSEQCYKIKTFDIVQKFEQFDKKPKDLLRKHMKTKHQQIDKRRSKESNVNWLDENLGK